MKHLLFALALAFALASAQGCRKKAVLKGLHPAKTNVEATVTTINSGTVEAESQAVLGFGVAGRVAAIQVKAGDRVERGTVLASQENADLKAIYQEAEKENERVKKLFAATLISRVAHDESRKGLQVAKVNWERSVIVAPFDGIVAEINLRLGEQSGPQDKKPPVRLVDEKPRLVKGDIDEVDLAKVKVQQKARVRIPASRAEAFPGEVSRVVPFIDTTKEQDRTSQIELRLGTADPMIPVGASAEIEIVTGAKTGVLALPSRVILGSGKTRYVYTANDGTVAKRPIEIGMGNYDRTEVLTGLTETDVVLYPSDDVTLDDGLRVKTELVPWP